MVNVGRNFAVFLFFYKGINSMSKLVSMVFCSSILLAGDSNAADIMNGFLDHVSGLIMQRAAEVVERDPESGVFEELVHAERLINRAPNEAVHEPKVMIDGMQYVRLSDIDEIIENRENQITYVSHVLSVFKKCGEGDRKAIATVVALLLATHGFIKLFI